MTENNLVTLNGEFNVRAEQDSLIMDSLDLDYHNAFEKFYRGKGRGSRDTMKIESLDKYSFKLQVLDSNLIEIAYSKDSAIFRTFTLEYTLKKDGYAYLKNDNLIFIGIPYLYGGVDEKRLRIRAEENYLIIEEYYHSSGAILFLIGDSKTWLYTTKYHRIR